MEIGVSQVEVQVAGVVSDSWLIHPLTKERGEYLFRELPLPVLLICRLLDLVKEAVYSSLYGLTCHYEGGLSTIVMKVPKPF